MLSLSEKSTPSRNIRSPRIELPGCNAALKSRFCNQELARLHLTGDVDADLTPEQKRDRLNYMLQKAGYVRPNTETKQE